MKASTGAIKTATVNKGTIGTSSAKSTSKVVTTSSEIEEDEDSETPAENDEPRDSEPEGDQGSMQYDFKGRTIKLLGVGSDNRTTDFFDTNFSRYSSDGTYLKGYTESLDSKYEHWRSIERDMNCKIRVEWWGNWTTSITRAQSEIMAGVYNYSLTQLNSGLPVMVKGDFIYALSDYADIENHPKMAHPYTKIVSSYAGKYYTVSEDVPSYPHYCVLYNIDIMNRQGLPDLFSLYRSGKWTWDEFLNIAITATVDFNGDGIVDQHGIARMSDFTDTVASFTRSNSIQAISYNGEKFVSNLQEPSYQRCVNFLSNLINVHKVVNTDFTKAFMTIGTQFDHHSFIFARNNNLSTRFAPMPFGPDNTDRKVINLGGLWGWFIPKTEPDPKGITYLLLNLMKTAADKNKYTLSYDQALEEQKIYLQSRNGLYVPVLDDWGADLLDFWTNEVKGYNNTITDGMRYDYLVAGFGNYRGELNKAITGMIQTQTSAASMVDQYKPILNTILDQYN